MRLTFDAGCWDAKPSILRRLGERWPAKILGPDSVALAIESLLIKPGRGPAFIRTQMHLDLQSKVRPHVVARWLIEIISKWGPEFVHDGHDYYKDELGLAHRIADASTDLEEGSPSDAPSDLDDGGQGVGSRIKPKPGGLSGSAQKDQDEGS